MPINGDTVLGRRADLPGYSSRTEGYRLAGRPIAATPSVPAGDVMTARSEDRLILWYQPKIDVATRKLAGAEGLLRLVDPELGVLSPAAFLPGLTGIDMAVITAFVAERAIADWLHFADAGEIVRLSINAPPSTLETADLPELFSVIRPRHRDWPGLTVEMTEAEIIGSLEAVNDAIHRMTQQAISISIDDFGAGYSSLSRLKEVPFSEIKIDRGLIRGCDRDPSIRYFLKAVRDFAHYHGARVVAEGVETTGEFRVVADLGIDEAQGFLFARPMPPEEFLRAIRRPSWFE
ncbi:EAL domain-containing protein [Pseudoxanthobacter sp. M-2]|uniref:EAL domain-containing protein n=1 Tax=Pseudoxanthobacter sp. M-2 TaxID=3078754 RepID=UPI0038FC3CF4